MSNSKISALTSASTPLAGTEVLPIVQSSATTKVTIANITAGRSVSAAGYVMSTGNLVPSTAAKGVNFTANTPAAGMTSQLLNWYEEGTWTPVLGGATSEVSQTYDLQTGLYTRIGRQVTAQFRIAFTNKGVIVGALQIKGLPFTLKNANGAQSALSVSYFVLASNVVWLGGAGTLNGTVINLYKLSAAASNSSAMATADIDNSSAMIGSFTYFI